MARNIKVQLIVHGDVSNIMLNEAVCRYFESKGFKTAMPHIYPEDPLIIEVVEPIPNFDY